MKYIHIYSFKIIIEVHFESIFIYMNIYALLKKYKIL